MKTVLITGANKGIGFETARQLAEAGYFVYLGARDKTNGDAAVQKLRDTGLDNIAAITIDVTDARSIQDARQELETKTPSLDVLINNAGIAGDKLQHISTGMIDNLRKIFETNFFGAVQTTQTLLPLLQKAPRPVIINVSSELGSLTMHSSPDRNPNWVNFDAYSCSKTALNAFTVLLANEMRSANIRVNSVTPGYTATDLNGFAGIQTAEQGARYIVQAVTRQDLETGHFYKTDEIPW